jgi:hypothetical protein
MGRRHDEVAVIGQLQRKGLHIENGHIKIPFGTQLGNSSNGKLDFLVNHKGYTRVYEPERIYRDQASDKVANLKKKYQKESRKNLNTQLDAIGQS